jgi:hypothetical protein
MALAPATPNQLESVQTALAEFRAHWEAILPPFICMFDGSLDDIHALDHLDYVGLAYPPCGEAGAALVWGSVVASKTPFRWFFDDELGGLVLRPPGVSLVIWPFGRVYESRRCCEPQFGKYRWLLDWVVVQCLGHPVLEPDDSLSLVRALAGQNQAPVRFMEHALKRLREFQGDCA